MPYARVTRLPMDAPDDVGAIAAAIAEGTIAPRAIRAVLAKTEGNGCVNDFTRAFAVSTVRRLLSAHVGEAEAAAVCLVASGGTEGGLSPHWLVIEALDGDHPTRGPALAVGTHVTRALAPEEIGTRAQIDVVAAGVAAAMRAAGITRADDVHYVQVKCPLLTLERIASAEARGASVATSDTLKSMGLSRGAAALGVAAALGEIPPERIATAIVGADRELWSSRASASAGVELTTNEIVVLGTSPVWSGPLRIDHAVMADGIDIEPVREALARLGHPVAGQMPPRAREAVVAVLAKAEAPRSGRVRGRRHTMLDDSDISATRHARAYAAGALGALFGESELFVSGGAEHQGPDGGGPCAVIVHRPDGDTA